MQPRLLAARGHLTTAGKLVGALLGAWLGGNVVFGVLAAGAWPVAAALAFLPEWAFDWIAIAMLWLCRAAVFVLLLIEWVFPKDRGRMRT